MTRLYNVLRPIYHLIPGQKESYRVEWEIIGTTFSYQMAKAQFGGYPILERFPSTPLA